MSRYKEGHIHRGVVTQRGRYTYGNIYRGRYGQG